MRDIGVFLIVVTSAAYALVHPWVGVLAWTWVSIMNPHRLGWGFIVDFPVAMVIAIGTLAGLFITRDRRYLPISAPVVVLFLFVLWMCFTSALAIYPELIGEMFSRVMKIMLMIFVAMAVLNTRRHVDLLVWVLVISLGFYGLKGGLFTIVTGGTARVWGPQYSFIEGNNEVALALIMAIPLMRYLQIVTTHKWVRRGLGALMVLSALAALGSHSRGALVAIAAMALVLWVRSTRKMATGVAIMVLGAALIAFMPSNWDQRMQTIGAENLDASAMGRINAWWMAWNLVKERPIGGGFEVTTPELFAKYAPDPTDIHAAHSIYFQVLGEHGFVGVFLFVLLWWLVWRWAGRLYREGTAKSPDAWSHDLGRMIQVSLIAYLVGGAFLSLAYFDLPYNLVVLVVVARKVIDGERSLARGGTEKVLPALQPAPTRRYA